MRTIPQRKIKRWKQKPKRNVNIIVGKGKMERITRVVDQIPTELSKMRSINPSLVIWMNAHSDDWLRMSHSKPVIPSASRDRHFIRCNGQPNDSRPSPIP